MAKSEANRGVIFTLKAKTDASVGAEFGKVSDRAAALQKKLDSLHIGLDAAAFETSLTKIERQYEGFMAKVNGASPAPKARTGANASAVNAELAADKLRTAIAAQEAAKQEGINEKVIRNRIKMLDRIAKFDEKKRADEESAHRKEEAAAEKSARAAEKAAEAKQRAEEKAAAVAEREAEKSAKAAEREADKKRKAEEKCAVAAERAAQKQAVEQERAYKKAERAAEVATDKLKESHLRVAEWSERGIEGVLQFGRAFVELGLIGENDLGKIKDALLSVQSVIDAAHGAIDLYKSITRGVEAYRAAVISAEVAERALAAARALSAASSGAQAASGASSGIAGRIAGGAAVGAAGSTVTSGGAGTVATAAAPAAAWASAILGSVAAVVSGVLTGREAMKYGIGGGATHGSTVDKIATWEVSMAEWIHARDLGTRKTEELTAATSAQKTQRQEIDRNITAQYAEQNRQGAARLEAQQRLNAAQFETGPYASQAEQYQGHRQQLDADRGVVQAELERINRQIVASTGSQGEHLDGHEEALGAREAIEEKIQSLQERELQLAHEKRQVDIDGAKQHLALLGQQLTKIEAQGKAARDAARAAREKAGGSMASFAHLTATEQEEFGRIKAKGMHGGTLTQKEEEFLEKHSGGDEQSQLLLRGIQEKRGREANERIQKKYGVGYGTMEEQEARNRRGLARSAGEEEAQKRQELRDAQREANAKNKNAEFNVNMDNTVDVKITGDSNLETKVKSAFIKALKDATKDQDAKIQGWIDEARAQAVADANQNLQRQQQRANQARNAKS